MTEVSAAASFLGYTHNAIKKLNESRAMLDRYVQHQTSRIDAIHEQNQSTLNQQNDRIQSSLSKLKSIQRQRGVSASGVSHGEGLSSPSTDKENTNDVNGIVQQQKSLAERQMEVERQLANLHLEQKEVQKSLKGKCVTFIAIAMFVGMVFSIRLRLDSIKIYTSHRHFDIFDEFNAHSYSNEQRGEGSIHKSRTSSKIKRKSRKSQTSHSGKTHHCNLQISIVRT